MGLTGFRTAPARPVVGCQSRKFLRRIAGMAMPVLALMLASLAMPPSGGLLAIRSVTADELAVTQPAWTVSQLQGSARSRTAGMTSDTDWIDLDAGTSLQPGTEITTGENGFVVLVNGTDRVQVMANSHVQLPAVDEPGVLTRVLHHLGTVFFEVGKRPGRRFEVDTPYLVAIVKGTKFSTQVSDAGGWVNVTEGVVGVTASATGASVDVTPGKTATVSAGSGEDVQVGPTPPGGVPAAPGGPLQSPASLTKPADQSTPTDTSPSSGDSNQYSGQGDGNGKGGGKGNGYGSGNSGNGDDGDDNDDNSGDGEGDGDDEGQGCNGGGNCNGHDDKDLRAPGKNRTAWLPENGLLADRI